MAVNIYDIDYDKVSKCKIEGEIVSISDYSINGTNDEYLKISTLDNYIIVFKNKNTYKVGDYVKNIINTENNFLLEYASNIDYWSLKKYSNNEYEKLSNIPKCISLKNNSQNYFIFGGIFLVIFIVIVGLFLKKYFKNKKKN